MKTLTTEQKKALELKRLANPQSSHLASKVQKYELLEFKQDAKANIIEAKRLHNKIDLKDKTYENLAEIKMSIKVSNLICKKPELLKLAEKAVRTNKDGSYSVYYFSQLIQAVVKKIDDKTTVQSALLQLKK